MPRYFFHLYNDVEAPDLEGRDLPDDAAARAFAMGECRELIASDVLAGGFTLAHRIEVENAYRQTLFTVRFADAVAIKGLPIHSGAN